MSETTRGPSKGDKRARTRAKLLEAARELIRERGHEGVSIDDIARRAGMTSGAVYGNFRNRDELFVALGEAYWAPVKPKIRLPATVAEIMRALADATITALPERRPAAVGRLKGMAYALSTAEAAAQVQAYTARSYAVGAEWLRSASDAERLPAPPEQMVVIIHALTEGLVFQRFLTPDLVTDAVIHAAFAALAGVSPQRD